MGIHEKSPKMPMLPSTRVFTVKGSLINSDYGNRVHFQLKSAQHHARVVMQRVTSGCVRVEGEIVGQISKGLVCLVGIGRDDTEADAEFCCRRLLVSSSLRNDPVEQCA
jgi:hypothetical protein